MVSVNEKYPVQCSSIFYLYTSLCNAILAFADIGLLTGSGEVNEETGGHRGRIAGQQTGIYNDDNDVNVTVIMH